MEFEICTDVLAKLVTGTAETFAAQILAVHSAGACLFRYKFSVGPVTSFASTWMSLPSLMRCCLHARHGCVKRYPGQQASPRGNDDQPTYIEKAILQ